MNTDDKAGPLWLLLESFLEWLGFWGRLSLALVFLLALIALIAFLTRRKS